MSGATLLRAYRLAVQRETQVWSSVPAWTGNTPVPKYHLDYWRWCQAKQERYAQLRQRLEARLLKRLGVGEEPT
jgi:hypothetical protein